MTDATASVRITLLGGFAVVVDGAVMTAPWRLRKAKTLVKLLALRTGHRLHRDVLFDDVVELGGDGVVSVDVDHFEDAAARAAATGAVDDLRAALDTWSGELLP